MGDWSALERHSLAESKDEGCTSFLSKFPDEEYSNGHIMQHMYMHAYMHALHCIALHCIALHCIALHCIALHYITLHTYYTVCIIFAAFLRKRTWRMEGGTYFCHLYQGSPKQQLDFRGKQKHSTYFHDVQFACFGHLNFRNQKAMDPKTFKVLNPLILQSYFLRYLTWIILDL